MGGLFAQQRLRTATAFLSMPLFYSFLLFAQGRHLYFLELVFFTKEGSYLSPAEIQERGCAGCTCSS